MYSCLIQVECKSSSEFDSLESVLSGEVPLLSGMVPVPDHLSDLETQQEWKNQNWGTHQDVTNYTVSSSRSSLSFVVYYMCDTCPVVFARALNKLGYQVHTEYVNNQTHAAGYWNDGCEDQFNMMDLVTVDPRNCDYDKLSVARTFGYEPESI